MSRWPRVTFDDACSDVSSGNKKIQKGNLLRSGRIPVVDQGVELVAGYTDDLTAVVSADGPLLVFGDHTRRFKYVDGPFAMGADGVKVLAPRSDFDPRFLFRLLQSLDIPSAGYSRHFKFLKQVSLPKPPISEQQRIADVLDRADALRAKRRETLARLKEAQVAHLAQLLSDTAGQSHRTTLGDCADVQGGLQVTRARDLRPLRIPYLRVANVHRGSLDLREVKSMGVTTEELARCRLLAGDLLFVEGHGNASEIGRSALWRGELEECAHQNHLIRARLHTDMLLPEFAEGFVNSSAGRSSLLRRAKTTSGLNTITVSDVRRIPVLLPSLIVQAEYVEASQTARRLASVADSSLDSLDALFASLQQRAFRGDLFDSPLPAELTDAG